jgi:hypothetical protein
MVWLPQQVKGEVKVKKKPVLRLGRNRSEVRGERLRLRLRLKKRGEVRGRR